MNDALFRAEQSVLGGLMLDASKLPVVEKLITATDFSDKQHGHLFGVITKIIGQGFNADPVALLEHVQGNDDLLQYVGMLFAETPGASNILAYCEIVRDFSEKRKLKKQLTDALKKLDTPKFSLSSVVESLDHGVQTLRDRLSNDSKSNKEVAQTISASNLVRKTFPEPRWAVGELIPEGVTLLCGKPKMGKSWLALNIGMAIGLGGKAIDAGTI